MQSEYLKEPKLLIGKVVVCISNQGENILTLRDRYLVIRVSGVVVQLSALGGMLFSVTRFEVVGPEFLDLPFVGRKVKCIRNSGTKMLTLNKEYTISKYEENSSRYNYQVNDDGNSGTMWMSDRFEFLPIGDQTVTAKSSSTSSDCEEERLRAIFLTPPPDTCICGAPKSNCQYH